MRNNYKKEKKRMAYMGYYTQSDYAKMIGVSRQHVWNLISKGKLKTFGDYGKWVIFDKGEKAVKIYGNTGFDVFERFGFKRRTKSLVISDKVICDIKMLDVDGKICIRFYDDNGGLISLLSDLKTLEIINEE